MHAQRTSTGWPVMPSGYETRRYHIGWDNPDGSKTAEDIEASSEENAQEIVDENLRNMYPTFVEEIDEPEEPDTPIRM